MRFAHLGTEPPRLVAPSKIVSIGLDLAPGDLVEVEIEGIGTLRNPVVGR